MSEEDIGKLFELMGRLNQFFHQPLNFANPDIVRKFADENYPIIRSMYYDTLWNALPEHVRREMLDRPDE